VYVCQTGENDWLAGDGRNGRYKRGAGQIGVNVPCSVDQRKRTRQTILRKGSGDA
jgi:hypothetical protein